MENVYPSSHPLIASKLTLLRDVTTEPKKFRELVRELSAMLTYEATADLAVKPVRVQTPLMETDGVKLLELFSADGKLVGSSRNGSITAPSSGIYIVVADGKRLKLRLCNLH